MPDSAAWAKHRKMRFFPAASLLLLAACSDPQQATEEALAAAEAAWIAADFPDAPETLREIGDAAMRSVA